LLSIHIELYGHSGLHDWPEMQGGDPIPSEASGEVDALFTVPANDTFPDGAPAELLIVALAADLAYYGSIDWSCKLYRGEDEIATMDAENDELLLSAVLGETLRLHAWADDGVWWAEDLFSLENYHSTLDINVYTLSAVPEPSALALLCVGAVGLLACGRRKRP